jgi:hypothetical protein
MSSIDISSASSPLVFRIVSLPRELHSSDNVEWYVNSVLQFGPVRDVKIIQRNTPNGIVFRSAIVAMTGHFDTELARDLIDRRELVLDATYDPNYQNVQYHFDNGKPMQHIKLVLMESEQKHEALDTPPTDAADAWMSIYIPVVPNDLSADYGDVRYNDEPSFAELFEDHLGIGEVSRVDFVTKSIPGSEREVRSAYVHFNKWNNNRVANIIRNTINDKGEYKCNGYFDGDEFRKFDNSRFVSFKVNHRPIPAAAEDMNVHQLSAAKDFLEKRVAELEKQIAELKCDKEELERACAAKDVVIQGV